MIINQTNTRNNDMSLDESTQPSVLCGMLACSPRRLEFARDESSDDEGDCSVADELGNLPLHNAVAKFALDCLNAPSDQSLYELHIESLVERYPEAVHTFNSRGLAPLHIACREGASLAVIHALVQVWPESVKTTTRNRHQMLPLHLVCRYHSGKASEKFRILHYLLRAFPASIEIATASGDLALHLACQNYFCTLAIIDLLVKAYPEGLRTLNDKQQLPLHIACGHQYMQRLSHKHSHKNHKKKKNFDNSHSHFEEDKQNSCSSGDIIRRLVEAYPGGAEVFDCTGTLPLHAAVKGYQSTATIRYLVDACPEAVEYTDHAGRTALHLAVSRQIPCLRTVELLLAENPAAVDALDDRNRLPVHYVKNQASLMSALEGVITNDTVIC